MTTTSKTAGTHTVRAHITRDHTDVNWTVSTDRPLRWLDGRDHYPTRADAWGSLLIACLHEAVGTLHVGAERLDVREAALADRIARPWVTSR